MRRMWALAAVLCCLAPAVIRGQGPGGNLLDDLTRLRDGVKSKRISSYDRSGGNDDRLTNIQPGEKRELAAISGAGIINHIWVTIAPPPPTLSRHDIILRMYWDGETNPSVEAPIGDFFGQGWNESYPFISMPLAATPREGRGMVCYFQMPFAKSARIEIENDSTRKIDAFYYQIDYVDLSGSKSANPLPANTGYFHAWYNHQLTPAQSYGETEWGVTGTQGKNTSDTQNYVFADLAGKGQFVGVNYFVHSPGPMWYGEGDDMFLIDGEPWPGSLHGTGTEDYFNTSWSPATLYAHPFFGYAKVSDQLGWIGKAHMYRFHITDPIYFDKSLRATIEHGHDNNLTLDLSSVAYWYQREPHKVFPKFPTRDERKPMPDIRTEDIHRWRNEWRKNNGNDPKLWGNERPATPPKQP
jgi:hypothetical protein